MEVCDGTERGWTRVILPMADVDQEPVQPRSFVALRMTAVGCVGGGASLAVVSVGIVRGRWGNPDELGHPTKRVRLRWVEGVRNARVVGMRGPGYPIGVGHDNGGHSPPLYLVIHAIE